MLACGQWRLALLHRRYRELDMQRQPAVVVPRRPDPPAVRLHDRAADGETQPQSLGLAADEMLEDVLQIRVLNAHAGIADVDFDNGAIGGDRLYVDRAWTGHAGGDGIASVHQHVEN